MKIVAIVVTYKGEKWIRSCLKSLEAAPEISEIIVIENASGDATLQILADEFPGVRSIASKQNLGFGGGNNLGFRAALEGGADFVFLLNQDAWVDSDTMPALLESAKDRPEFGIISPVHLNGDGSLLDQRFLDHLCERDRAFFTDLFLSNIKKIHEVHFINAAAWLIRAECLKTVGLFDPIFFHYGEDKNYADRCRYFGYKTGLCLDAKIWHDREERIGGRKVDRRYKFEPLRTAWATVQTDPGDEAWDQGYAWKLMRFVVRRSARSFTHVLVSGITYLRLFFYRGAIAEARERMKAGYPAYMNDGQEKS
jgi:GT2 family glycosyltransferase